MSRPWDVIILQPQCLGGVEHLASLAQHVTSGEKHDKVSPSTHNVISDASVNPFQKSHCCRGHINAVITNGITRIEDSLDVTESMQPIWRVASHRLRNRADGGRAVAGMQPVNTATQIPSLESTHPPRNKRIASSLLKQHEDKKMRDEKPLPKWPTVESKKAKR